VVPATGPFAGGNRITVSGRDLCYGSDITEATIDRVAATVLTQTASAVVLLAPAHNTAGLASIVITSLRYGTTAAVGMYQVHPPGVIFSVVPSEIRCRGGEFVTITGANLGDGTDIYSVWLRGVPTTVLYAQSSTAVVVLSAPTSVVSGAGSVVIHSTSFGDTVRTASVTYFPGT
jgi:hypothetical protein